MLPADSSGKNQYTVFDFAPLLSSGALPHGLFWLKIQAWDPVNNVPLGSLTPVQSSPMAGGAYGGEDSALACNSPK